MITIGNIEPNDLALGDAIVDKAYLGNELVWGTSLLPSGYARLTAIRNNGTAYLPVSVKLNTNVRYELESMGNGSHFSWNSTGNKEIIIFRNGSKNCYLNGKFTAPNYSVSKKYKIVIDLARESNYARAYIDDVLVRQTSINLNTNSSIQLFRDAYRSISFKITIYSFKAYSGDTLVNNYIPAKRLSDGVIGVYDVASNTFLASPNGSSFTAVI